MGTKAENLTRDSGRRIRKYISFYRSRGSARTGLMHPEVSERAAVVKLLKVLSNC